MRVSRSRFRLRQTFIFNALDLYQKPSDSDDFQYKSRVLKLTVRCACGLVLAEVLAHQRGNRYQTRDARVAFRVSNWGILGQRFGFRVGGLGCRVPGYGFRVSGSGCRVSVFGCRVSGCGFSVERLACRV